MKPEIVTGDLLEQTTDAIVNSWNRNVIPWWLLLPQGGSGEIKKRAGLQPFREVARFGPIPLGEARVTSAGNLPHRAIIHVAGINIFWFATEYSVTRSVISAMQIVHDRAYRSVAFPLIGSGSGNRGREWSLNVMLEAFEPLESSARVVIVRYGKGAENAHDQNRVSAS